MVATEIAQDVVAVATLLTAAGGFVASIRATGHAKRSEASSAKAVKMAGEAVDVASSNRDLITDHLQRVEKTYASFAEEQRALLDFLKGAKG